MSRQYALLKYRGLAVDGKMLLSKFLYMYAKLVAESNEGGLDPFLYKVLAKPPTR